MKATARAPANIAFIKYWGKTDAELRLPCNTSVSVNLSNAYSVTTVEFSKKFTSDEIYYGDQKMDEKEKVRVVEHLNRVRQLDKSRLFAKVVTQNSFPKSTGIASSASGFAALTLAACASLKLKLSEKELSILARLGSGSAARSIPDGFVEWKAGDNQSSYAYTLYSEKYWELRDIILVVETGKKKTSSTKGHENAKSSIFYKTRLVNLPVRITKLKNALKNRNMKNLGGLLEEEAVELHMIMMTQKPPLFYWTDKTTDIINNVYKWREEGIAVYFTLDAGPNVHLICEAKEEKKVLAKAREIPGIKNIIINAPAAGARLIGKHLF